ncbi:MAG TPA: 4-(cytidine 5'-diphospho)-2-C-methyl-D-erythritol kinase [Bacteroidales bacterium]|nr:4-(cytidine 5'-diphospho)-2-C-methyl-D-erythritol kinase [Bacteroidales bacterium]
MICFPNAKINIGLRILEKQPDGYHQIETIFYPAGLSDILEFVEDSSLNSGICQLKITGLPIRIHTENNLVKKAYDLMSRKRKLPGIQAHLHKMIPIGAGLGGGSSDAAFMLKSLNDVYELALGQEEMAELAANIGSDCPFFLRNTPVFAFGRGERFREIDLNLSGYYLVIVLPGIHVSTPEAYASVSPAKPEKSLYDLIRLPLNSWKETIINDFEANIFHEFPELRIIKEELYHLGAEFASMSGSGSAVYGLFLYPPQNMGIIEKYFYWQGKLG